MGTLMLEDDCLHLRQISTTNLTRPRQALNEGNHNRPSSINGFPSEILVYTFELAVSAPENAILRPRARIPFNVSQVSRLWRVIALNTPNL
ncbi:hypothetical protein BOTBODRAFT_403056 [Botryobasidium botryosum FD-172 SS1]|uniref:F-box domain-containing protein n=1 Tax=Botryobasidium botryosum (strain FD-172 SS1) TaxID=930990 RepID=A0A067MDT6_BOTB1|nr:hypothetical protein BOTBODRAFT_403056 [Botryobasidium botryosum FD-172 SS1]